MSYTENGLRPDPRSARRRLLLEQQKNTLAALLDTLNMLGEDARGGLADTVAERTRQAAFLENQAAALERSLKAVCGEGTEAESLDMFLLQNAVAELRRRAAERAQANMGFLRTRMDAAKDELASIHRSPFLRKTSPYTDNYSGSLIDVSG
jgi:hypothetical protein